MEEKKTKKCTSTTWSEWATVGATFISIIMLGLAIPAVLVSINELKEISQVVVESQPIQLTIGIHNGEDAFLSRVNATYSDERAVQFSFRNISGNRMSTIGARVMLPLGLEIVPESTVLYNRTNPNGLTQDDSKGVITDVALSLGGYSSFDEQGRGSGSVSFRVKVSDDESRFALGGTTRDIVVYIGGYIDGSLVTDTYSAVASIDVITEMP